MSTEGFESKKEHRQNAEQQQQLLESVQQQSGQAGKTFRINKHTHALFVARLQLNGQKTKRGRLSERRRRTIREWLNRTKNAAVEKTFSDAVCGQ